MKRGKKIGLIGGISWQSSLEYYRLINTYYAQSLGEDRSAETILINLDRALIDDFANKGDEESIYQSLIEAGQALEAAGADFVVMCANGVHRFYEKLINNISLPFLHIADSTAMAIQKAGIKKIGLLGIRKTMEEGFYHERLNVHGIETIVPELEDRQTVHRIIFDELVRGVFTRESRKVYLEIMAKLMKQGAEGIVLGCTEIPLLISEKDTAIPIFSTTDLHCRAAVEQALGL